MAIQATARGTGGNNTGATTLAVSPTSDFLPGTLAVLCLALDNSGASGVATTLSYSATGSTGWATSQAALYDPGAASAGVQTAIITCNIASFLTTDILTITFGNSTTAKAWTLTEVSSTLEWGYISATKIAGAAGTGAASGTPTVTTGSITSGDIVFGMGGAESADTWAGDADATNGSWSTHAHTAFGTGLTGMSVTSQYKIVTGTATQTYNPTLTSVDQILSWAQFRETVVPFPGLVTPR